MVYLKKDTVNTVYIEATMFSNNAEPAVLFVVTDVMDQEIKVFSAPNLAEGVRRYDKFNIQLVADASSEDLDNGKFFIPGTGGQYKLQVFEKINEGYIDPDYFDGYYYENLFATGKLLNSQKMVIDFT